MELKVYVEGIQRIVCGVSETTTCQDVVFALAHATGKIGRFTLIERWRNNERLLAPNENPLKILMKWGEYSSDVQFILQKSEPKAGTNAAPQQQPNVATNPTTTTKPNSSPPEAQKPAELNQSSPPHPAAPLQMMSPPAEMFRQKKMMVDANNLDGFGVEKEPLKKTLIEFKGKPAGFVLPHMKSPNHSPSPSSIDSNNFPVTNKVGNFNSMDVRNNLDRLNSSESSSPSLRPNSPPISSNGALVPPPYRDPPPPNNSNSNSNSSRQNSEELQGETNEVISSSQYRDLIQLIKFQREKLNSQSIDINKFDEEIEFLEQREREQNAQMEALAREIQKQDQIFRQGADQLQSLQYVEEENELVKQQEKTLKSEITLLRSKLANCETELLQCRNKIKYLMDEIQIEQRAMRFGNREQIERQIMTEMERLQGEIDQIVKNSEGTIKSTDSLKSELSFLEAAIGDKKKQVEQLVHEMKEVNLQSLAVTPPSEEIRHLLEGSNRPGSTRRIIGSPRQLENAVPTSKNPHGVWV